MTVQELTSEGNSKVWEQHGLSATMDVYCKDLDTFYIKCHTYRTPASSVEKELATMSRND